MRSLRPSHFLPALLLAALLATALDASPAQAAPGYPWLSADDLAVTSPLDTLQPAPDGFVRVPAATGSAAAWFRSLPIKGGPPTVSAYDGSALRAPAAHVVAMDVGTRDLQQCADSAIRLLSEYAWAQGTAAALGWNFTSGDRTQWSDWLAGERFTIGRTVKRSRGAARANTHATFRSWLNLVFTYAGTRSLAREGEPVGDQPIEAGDVFVSAGSPGHAVVVLDVAEHPDGRRAALLGQGFMPAQEFHVLRTARSTSPVLDEVWFILPGGEGVLDTPSWAPFQRGDARRFLASDDAGSGDDTGSPMR